MFKAMGYEVSYLKGSLGTSTNPVTKWGLERMLFAASATLASSNCVIVVRDIEASENNNVGKVDLLFVVPDTANRRDALLKAIDEFEQVVTVDYTKYLNLELRKIEPEIFVDSDIVPAGLH